MASSSSAMNTNPLLEQLEDGKIYDLDLGETWNSMNDGNTSKYAYHTIKYDFKPASVVKSDQAEVTVASTQDVTITLPNIEGSLTQATKFSGSTKAYTPKECLMIIDPQTGKIVLERLSANVRVKNVRMENRAPNPTIKTAPPRTNPPESQPEKKTPKNTTTTTTTTPVNKSTTQKPANPSKPIVNAPVKPMPNKKPPSPMDHGLSDDESSPESSPQAPPPLPPAPVISSTNVAVRRPSHTTLEQDLQLSDTTDEED